jgi:hypothetical protein
MRETSVASGAGVFHGSIGPFKAGGPTVEMAPVFSMLHERGRRAPGLFLATGGRTMLDEGDVMARSRRDAAFIRLNVVHWHWRRAVLLLEAVGGRRCQPTNGVVYRFLTGIARDEALDLVLRTFGSTVANP